MSSILLHTKCTMPFFILYTSIVVTLINADDTTTQYQAPFSGQVTQPEDVGAVHTKAFEALAELHETNGRPADREGLLENAIFLMTGYCPPSPPQDNQACVDRMTRVTQKEFARSNEPTPRNVAYMMDDKVRSFLSPALVEPMERMETIVETLNGNDVNDVTSELEALRQDVLKLKEVPEAQRSVVLASLSVASESAKLWDQVYSDPTHALYGMHYPLYYHNNNNNNDNNSKDEPDQRQRRRRLDDYGGYGSMFAGLDIAGIVLADLMAGFMAGLEIVMEDFNVLTTNPQAVFLAAAAAAIPASISEVMGGGGGGGGGYDGYSGGGNDGYNGGGGGGYDSLFCTFLPIC